MENEGSVRKLSYREAYQEKDIKLYIPDLFDASTVKNIVRNLDKKIADDPQRKIKMYIDTYGGGIDAGIELAEYFRHVPNPLTTVARSKCMSAGVLLLSCGSERLAYPETLFLIHQAQIGEFQYSGPISHMKDELRPIYQQNRRWIEMIAENINYPYNQLFKESKEDNYFDAETALNHYHLITGILPTYVRPRRG